MILDWINNKFGSNLSEEDLLEVKNFTLLWNIFENTIFQNSFSIANLEQAIIDRNLQLGPFNEVFQYFQQRYVSNDSTNARFENLNFRQHDRRNLVSDCLLGLDNNPRHKILSSGIIVYRFRNNLFHGLKDFMFLGEQQDNFKNANRYLQNFLDT